MDYTFWKECSKDKPRMNQIVWGFTNKKTVELVRLALTEKEYETYKKYEIYFEGFWKSRWESMERKKSVVVTHWCYLDRPDKLEE